MEQYIFLPIFLKLLLQQFISHDSINKTQLKSKWCFYSDFSIFMQLYKVK
jgi:hypothetical protein